MALSLQLPKFDFNLGDITSNSYVTNTASLFLVLYASMARPQLPVFVSDLFDNALFRLSVLSLVVFMSGQNIQLSVMIAIAFTVSMNLLNEQKIAEGFIEGFRENMINEGFADAVEGGPDPESESESESESDMDLCVNQEPNP